jgi:hypothetical protein
MQISKTVVLDETDIGVEVWIELQGDRTWTPHVFTFTSATSTGGPPNRAHGPAHEHTTTPLEPARSDVAAAIGH